MFRSATKERRGPGSSPPFPRSLEFSLGEPAILERRGCALHYWTAGPPHAPPVVFTHGFTMDHRVFAPQICAMAKHYRVVVWDVRGHGRSKPLGDDCSIPAFASDLLAILDHLAIERAAHVGHSMGAYVAQEIELHRPDRISALVALSTTSLTFPKPPYVKWGAPLTVSALRVWPNSWTKKQIGWIAGIRGETRHYATKACANVAKADRARVWAEILRGYRDQPQHRIRCPLLIMHGSLDIIVGFGLIPRLAPGWAAREPNGQIRVVPWAGHNANLDNPDFTNRCLLEFLRAHWHM